MESKLEKEVRFLKIYAVVSTLIFAVLLFTASAGSNKRKFEEIDVERINVVEKDGKLKMVIANKARQHPGSVDGKYWKEREGKRAAGMIFFSERGDEIGGLIFDGNDAEGQFGSLTFDKFRGDQTIQLTHSERKDGTYFAGLRMNDQNMATSDFLAKREEIDRLPTKEARDAALNAMRDSGEAFVNRLFIGKAWNKRSMIQLNDAKGRLRLELAVEPNGDPKLKFFDESGKVIYTLPDVNQSVK